MTKFIVGAIIGALIRFLIAEADAADLGGQFSQVGFGDKTDQVVELLGRPDSEIAWETFSLQRKRWKWTAGGRSYVLIFVFDRVFTKKVCTGPAGDC